MHIVLVEEPDAKYIGHITPDSSSAESITEGTRSFQKIK